MGKFSLALGLGIGYVLGSRAGHGRYEQIQQAAGRLAEKPQVQEAVGKVRDSLPAPLQDTVDGLVQKAGGSTPAAPGPAVTGSFPMEDDEEVVVQTFSAMRGRSGDDPATDDPGNTAGPVPVNLAAEDEDPVAQTFSAYTERSADDPATERTS
ncbi:hypothetical protein [Blastococcus sp. TF02A-26]|uniref:hypothetical protein n=1 Tax=Blastococcus sp. TF02A-26 TaxID=2250577 RepID=UPI000DE85810|nr:hypothetical protein [Blastococcus sp. TF02A-26]RBY85288.1 hypothetical protein DQ240_11895 [Blastococcus sp. TF02A-26]